MKKVMQHFWEFVHNILIHPLLAIENIINLIIELIENILKLKTTLPKMGIASFLHDWTADKIWNIGIESKEV